MKPRTLPRPLHAPSFKGFRPASEASSRAKRRNRSANTEPETILCGALSEAGLRYRTNVAAVPGRPDVAFRRARVAVFCDGDFWHGRNWTRLKGQLERRANAAYWIPKIAANRARDSRTRRELKRSGWLVIRVWETDVRRHPRGIAAMIGRIVAQRRRPPCPRVLATHAAKMPPSADKTAASSDSLRLKFERK